MHLIDSHCHLDDDRFDNDRIEVINEARQIGVTHFIVPATTQQRWPLLGKLQQAHKDIHIAYGYHPMFMKDHSEADMDQLERAIIKDDAIAIGECGLDFFHSIHDEQKQKKLFEQQLSVAKNLSLPCIVHSRKSLDIVISMLRKKQLVGGVLHSFSGSLQQAKQLNDLGFKLGIAATVCFERAKKLQSIVKEVSIENVLLESDAPDQTGPDYQGLNQPAYLLSQLHKVAELKGMSVSDVAKQTTKNAERLFLIKND